ncbi:MAG: hypothetical protein K2F59_02280 [Eubacteriales bacterium]|nr:hypothetical protein [Eubacteriales bacterium]
MKKIILLMLSVLFILAGCSNKNSNEANKNNEEDTNSENTFKSLNGFLEYELPEGWQEVKNYDEPMEISIETVNTVVLVEYIQDIPENFIKFKEETIKLSNFKYNFLEDYNFKRNDKNITLKMYAIEDGSEDLLKKYCAIGTIEFDKNEDVFLGVHIVFSTLQYKDKLNEIVNVLDTIKFTDIKLEQERNTVIESKFIELTLQPLWQRYNKIKENGFYKKEEDLYLSAFFNTYSKEEGSPEEKFEEICLEFEENFTENNVKLYLDNTENLKDKTITSKAYETNIGDGYFNIIDFKNRDLFVIVGYSILSSEGKFEDIKKELDEMTNSINLIEDAEEKFEEYKSVQDAHDKINDFIEDMETENTNN